MASRNRGRKKTTIRDLSRLRATDEEVVDLVEQLSQPQIDPQAHIITAMLGQAILENELDDLLREHFTKSNDKTWDSLTAENGPLSTFNRKILTAYALGICDEVIRDGLNTVRKIRNAFAHSKKRLDFYNEQIVSELLNITLPSNRASVLYRELSDVKQRAPSLLTSAQSAYIRLCITLATELTKKETEKIRTKAYAAERRRRQQEDAYRNELFKLLAAPRPEPPKHGLLSFSPHQTDDPSAPTPQPSRPKPTRSGAKSHRSKDTE